ncbi:MAG: DNA starvation/stationary phase protection protein [Deltaproteobacteria bacterium]|jgi:starvation-inducible DNA-binding protein|nr:DNA starvation/stationary phase protection protein [Deltaproteobacteria bacterium]
MEVNIGISEIKRKDIVDALSRVLADTYVLYLKTHGFHWNVTGPMFNTLHLMFEGQYTEMALAVDLIAERIRALGAPAPGSYAAFLKLASIKEAEGVPPATEMIKELLAAHESLVRTLRVGLAKLDGVNDQATEDLFTQRLQLHEKTAWMLRSLLE